MAQGILVAPRDAPWGLICTAIRIVLKMRCLLSRVSTELSGVSTCVRQGWWNVLQTRLLELRPPSGLSADKDKVLTSVFTGRCGHVELLP